MQIRFIFTIVIIGLCIASAEAGKKEKKERKAKKLEQATEAVADNPTAPSPKQEVVRDWKGSSGKVIARGKFWHVGGGILQIREEGITEPRSFALSGVSLEDIQYLLGDRGRVIGPTCKLLRSGYAVSSDGRLTQIPASQKRIMGTVSDIIDETMAIIKIGTKSYMVMCDTSKLKKGKKFEGYLKRQSTSKISLPNGQQGYLYRAYVAIESQKRLVTVLRKNPRPYLNQITGSSAEYAVWLETQRQLGKLKANQERQEKIAAERSKAKSDKEKEKADQAKRANREKLIVKYEKEIDRYETRQKEAEADIKRLEYRKRSTRLSSKKYSSTRNRIAQLKSEVLKIKKTIRDFKKKLLEVE